MHRLPSAHRAAAVLAAVLLVAGCATQRPTPPSDELLRARYDEDLAACRAQVASMDTLRQALDGVVEGALVTAIVLWGLGRSADGVRDGAAIGALLGGTSQGAQALERRQQTEVGCMSLRGHAGHQPLPQGSAPLPAQLAPVTPTPAPVAVGVDSFNVERLARAQACRAAPLAALVAKGPGFETYSVPCDNGDALAVRCEFGHCRVLR
jgi:hypothetical protein